MKGARVNGRRAVPVALALAATSLAGACLPGPGSTRGADSDAAVPGNATTGADAGEDKVPSRSETASGGGAAAETNPLSQGPHPQCLASGESPIWSGSRGRPQGGLRAQVRSIAAKVERLRHLRFKRSVDADLVSDRTIERRVNRLALREYSQNVADTEGRILGALGAIPRDSNLRRTRAQLLAGQVAGFYVPRSGELVVRSEASGRLPAIDQITLAHELEHALADQRLGFPNDDKPRPEQEDSYLAALSVVEGDATLTMERYASLLTLGDRLSLLGDAVLSEGSADGFQGVPHFLRQELTFPYLDGSRFVCALYRQGGWKAVNKAYRRPPSTTAQIMFPHRYWAGEKATDPRDPGSPGRSWDLARKQAIGAAHLLWLFEAPGGLTGRAIEDPLGVTREWAGGELELWVKGRRSGIGIALEARASQHRLCDGVTEWYDAVVNEDHRYETPEATVFAAGGGGQAAAITCRRGEVHVGIAALRRVARALAGANAA
jgi:hypothetical protein